MCFSAYRDENWQVKFYYTGRIDLLPPVTTDKDEAFGNILNLSENESYVDFV